MSIDLDLDKNAYWDWQQTAWSDALAAKQNWELYMEQVDATTFDDFMANDLPKEPEK